MLAESSSDDSFHDPDEVTMPSVFGQSDQDSRPYAEAKQRLRTKFARLTHNVSSATEYTLPQLSASRLRAQATRTNIQYYHENLARTLHEAEEAFKDVLVLLTTTARPGMTDAFNTEHGDLARQRLGELEEAEAAAAQAHAAVQAQAQAPAQQQAAQPRFNSKKFLDPANLPDQMNVSWSPKRFETWFGDTKVWAKISEISTADLEVQLYVLKKILPAKISERMVKELDPIPFWIPADEDLTRHRMTSGLGFARRYYYDEHPIGARRTALCRRRQKGNEELWDYITAVVAEFDDVDWDRMTPAEIKMTIILNGISSEKLREELYLKNHGTIDELVKDVESRRIAAANANSGQQEKVRQVTETANYAGQKNGAQKGNRKKSAYKVQKQGNSPPKKGQKPAKQEECFRCGDKSHKAPDCKYKSTKCSKCQKVGHLAKVCRSSNSKPPKKGSPQKARQTTEKKTPERANAAFETAFMALNRPRGRRRRDVIRLAQNSTLRSVMSEIQVSQKGKTGTVLACFDTGATSTILAKKHADELGIKLADEVAPEVLNADGHKIKMSGTAHVKLTFTDSEGRANSTSTRVLIAKELESGMLLGIKQLRALKVVPDNFPSIMIPEPTEAACAGPKPATTSPKGSSRESWPNSPRSTPQCSTKRSLSQ